MSVTPPPKKPSIVLTVGSKVSVRSAGNDSDPLVSNGTFRGLVSIGGDSSLALELDGKVKEEKGRIRLIPINALLSLDVLEAMKPEEEKRSEPPATGYFR
ncbi:MAG: hypothetical protein L3J95_04000 [Thermoplasmata archaeon]|nr:hypothetical protein [Thermoplasmata archaeon]MCI4359571.1 hypothetical protein [Thermoplasmata archaeon]